MSDVNPAKLTKIVQEKSVAIYKIKSNKHILLLTLEFTPGIENIFILNIIETDKRRTRFPRVRIPDHQILCNQIEISLCQFVAARYSQF